ncbi:MAG TPA: bifunctional phosphopantothenoylcysteine decarboxylase/phosphopantothenate--cysteine ligase CoaBC [Gemmatimonadales bacterium]|nr:bifunctional phosphopantothenoylcysteine decarboxylase/phosphopantothenate--cysteine ligase CoaBC [Gemmatimonadales bacterium]
MRLAGRHVVLGVSGGIACYKSCTLARRLTEDGARVDVVMTAAATEFVRPLTFEALTGRRVVTSLWEPGRALAHIELAKHPDLVVVAPATAQLLARAAQGLADDFLTSVLVARSAPILAAPAMNDAMYAHPATQANLRTLRERGWHVVGPEIGALAEGPSERPGRMSEPEAILAEVRRLLAPTGPWRGRHVVVTAGPTREHLDPVRVITNPSSGRMGFALAEAALDRGAAVTLVTGPTDLPPPAGATVVRIESTEDLKREVQRVLSGASALFMAAAPADFRPAAAAKTKRPRAKGALTLALAPTPDVLASLKRPPGCLMVGFALETGDGLKHAERKLKEKKLDAIVLNDALEPGAGFEVSTNKVTILIRDGERVALPLLSKREVAERILDAVTSRLP